MGDTDKQATWHNLSGCKTGKISFSTIYSADEEPEIKSKNDAKEDDNSSSKKDGEQDDTDKNVDKDGGDKQVEIQSSNEKKDNAPMKEQDQATPIADSDNKKVGETVQQEKEEIEEETGDTAPDSFINDIYTSEGKQSVPEKIEMKENISSTEKALEVIISENEKSEENVKSLEELEEHQNDEKTTSLEKGFV